MKRAEPSARLAWPLIGLAALVGLPNNANAYCRTATCGNAAGTECLPASPDDCGKPLYWSSPCVGYSLQQDASKQVGLSSATDVVHQAFSAWETASCAPSGHPRIEGVDMGPVACGRHEYNQRAGNANVIAFRDDAWPHQGEGDALALTTITYNLDTGEIYDADMEINSAQALFTTGDIGIKDDLLSVITHEVGHFLGLAHSADPEATMTPTYSPGSTTLRSLSADDIAGICAVYPPGAPIPSTCDPTPRHGFSSLCASDQPASTPAPETSACCTIAPGAHPESATGTKALPLFALGLLSLVAKRRARRRAR
jgi:hypothetical protein